MSADTPSHSDLRKAAEAQPFERYPALASWIERLANGGHLSLGNWMTFIGSLNAAIVQAETRSSDEISALRGALEKARASVNADAAAGWRVRTVAAIDAALKDRANG